MKDNSKFWSEIKTLVIFLASGAFVKVHKEFMEPSPDKFPSDHWTNSFHHWLHFFIGAGLQVLFCVWLVRIIWVLILEWIESKKKGNTL